MKNYDKAVKKIEIKLNQMSNESSNIGKEIVELAKAMIGAYAQMMENNPDLEEECCEGIEGIWGVLSDICKK